MVLRVKKLASRCVDLFLVYLTSDPESVSRSFSKVTIYGRGIQWEGIILDYPIYFLSKQKTNKLCISLKYGNVIFFQKRICFIIENKKYIFFFL